jgi:hypothetical protein
LWIFKEITTKELSKQYSLKRNREKNLWREGMDLTGIITGSITIVSLFVGLPGIVLNFIYKTKKNKTEMIKQQKELLELEIEKEKIHLKLLEEENRKYDKIIGNHSEGHILMDDRITVRHERDS